MILDKSFNEGLTTLTELLKPENNASPSLPKGERAFVLNGEVDCKDGEQKDAHVPLIHAATEA